jgi:WD40 repeat protein
MRWLQCSLAAAALLTMTAASAAAQGRPTTEIVPQIEHSNVITASVFSPNGKWVLTSSYDYTARLWETSTGLLLREFRGHPEAVYAATFSADGKYVLTGSHDKSIKIWETATGTLMRSIAHPGPYTLVFAVAYAPDGRRVYSGALDGRIRAWDAATGKLLRTLEGHASTVLSIALSVDGTRLVSGSGDKTLKLWDAAGGKLIRTFNGHTDAVASVAISSDGQRIASGSSDGTAKTWDAQTGRLIRTFDAYAGQPAATSKEEMAGRRVYAVALSPDGQRILSGGSSSLHIWEIATGKLLRAHTELGVALTAAYAPDGKHLITGGFSRAKLWEAATGQVVRSFEGTSNLYADAKFTADGEYILSSASDLSMKVWDPRSGRMLHSHKADGVVGTLERSALWRHFVAHGPGAAPNSITAATATIQPILDEVRSKGWNADIRSVAHSADGGRIVTVDAQRSIRVWDARSGRLIRTFDGSEPGARHWEYGNVGLSPDGTRLLTGAFKTVKLYSVDDGRLIRSSQGHEGGVTAISFSADGRTALSTGDDKTVKLWDGRTGTPLRTLRAHANRVAKAVFSHRGTYVASASNDGTARLWDVQKGLALQAFVGLGAGVSAVQFSPDDKRLLTGSLDGSVAIWDIASGQRLASFLTGKDGDWLAMSTDGFFTTSHRDPKMLAIVRGTEVTSIAQVHQSLFNPDLLREALAGDPGGEVAQAARVINLDKVVESGPPPAVNITSHGPTHKSTSELETVTARVTDMGKGVGRIEWRLNGITVGVASKPPGSGPHYEIKHIVALDRGENIVEVAAYNASNLLASPAARVKMFSESGPAIVKSRLHVLVIGINNYIDKGWHPPGASGPVAFPPLALAAKDAIGLAAALKQGSGKLYADVRVTTLVDGAATIAGIERAIDGIAAAMHPRDSFIFFAAAHGTSENGRFYLIPQNFQSGPGALQSSAIGQDRLQDWIANRIKAKRVVILLDTCESGALVAGHTRSRTEGDTFEVGLGRLHEATGRPVLTAAASGQFAHEGVIADSGERHGIFTWALLDALRRGDADGNGTIELSELAAHVQRMVPEIASRFKGTGRASIEALAPVIGQQSARFGSRGEDYALVEKLR